MRRRMYRLLDRLVAWATRILDSTAALLWAMVLAVVVPLALPGRSLTTAGFRWLNVAIRGNEDALLGFGLMLCILPILAYVARSWRLKLSWAVLMAGYFLALAISFLLGNPLAFGWSTYLVLAAWSLGLAVSIAWRYKDAHHAGATTGT